MFVDFRDQPPPPRWEPKPQPRKMTPQQERMLGWVLLANIVLLVIAPIGGATLVTALIALFGHG